MFPLRTRTFPADASELQRLLNKNLSEVLVTREVPVRVDDDSYPALKEIAINLDGASVRSNAPKPQISKGESAPALTVAKLSLKGTGVAIGPASVDLSLGATGVHLNRATDAEGQIVLGLERVADGKVEIAITTSDLENGIAELAQSQAKKHGVAIEDVRLTLRQLGPRAVEIEINLRARKMVFATTVCISGKAEIDEELNATISNLKCGGEGAIGSLASGFLTAQLEKMNGRSFSLLALPLGEIRLRDVRLEVADVIKVSAEFGA